MLFIYFYFKKINHEFTKKKEKKYSTKGEQYRREPIRRHITKGKCHKNKLHEQKKNSILEEGGSDMKRAYHRK